jgi:hypothetical protein
MRMNVRKMLAVSGLAMLITACGSEPASPPETASNAEPEVKTAPPAASSARRVFFVEPSDGATVKSPVRLRFGLEGYEISPVPQGTVESARPGVGHHHVGIDVDCLSPGAEIVRGTPSWVHFGDGKSEIDMQLPPGQHKLTLQLGDDQHKTIEGLCTTITVNVAQ